MASTSIEFGNYACDGYKVVVVASVLVLMQTLMVGGRLLSRRIQRVWLGIDDYVLISATIFTVSLCALATALPRITGVSNWPLQHLSNGKAIGQASIAWLVLYGISVALSKLAILLLYLRVFTSQMRGFTVVLIIVGMVVVGTGIANTFAAIFQCSPVPYAWDKTIEGGSCINDLAFARFMAIPNVVDGFVMLVMPIPLVWQLELATTQKVALTATFLHGIIGFIASIARLAILFQTNPTLDTNSTPIVWTIWTINEPANYIIAACLPTLRPILVRILPEKLFILSRKRGSSGNTRILRSPTEAPASPRKGTWSWPKGWISPKVSLKSRGASRLTGPWDRSRWGDEELGSKDKMDGWKEVRARAEKVGAAY